MAVLFNLSDESQAAALVQASNLSTSTIAWHFVLHKISTHHEERSLAEQVLQSIPAHSLLWSRYDAQISASARSKHRDANSSPEVEVLMERLDKHEV
jgi:hypothetical protein